MKRFHMVAAILASLLIIVCVSWPQSRALRGVISQDANFFTEEASQVTLTITNPEKAKGFENKSVKVQARVNSERREIFIIDIRGSVEGGGPNPGKGPNSDPGPNKQPPPPPNK